MVSETIIMKLAVPCNLEPEIVEPLNQLNKRYDNCIYEVYASLPRSVIGHCRKIVASPDIDAPPAMALTEFVEQIHSIGLKFNYVMNVTCLGNVEYTAEGRRKIDEYLRDVYDAGVDMVTVANPYVLEIIKQEYPGLGINASLTSEISSTHKAKFYEDLGATRITVDYMSNRNFDFLDKLRKTTPLELELLTNDICIFECPYRLYHYALVAHASKEGRAYADCIDYCLIRCTFDQANDLSELLKAPFIRPEDTGYYEKRFGIELFKISGRQQPVDWVLKAVEAYAQRKYDGNLLDIMAKFRENTFPNWHTYQAVRRSVMRFEPMKQFVCVDNGNLKVFFDRIVARGGCRGTTQCETCHYCKSVAGKFIQVTDESELRKYREMTGSALSELVRGDAALFSG